METNIPLPADGLTGDEQSFIDLLRRTLNLEYAAGYADGLKAAQEEAGHE
ncbi:MAG: hypothetical protein LBI19_02875 [Oscillospiraceae bacterium]|jgi:hypothetical protein|nr:hypothetical protein [Oscillospiraceae bacterium]